MKDAARPAPSVNAVLDAVRSGAFSKELTATAEKIFAERDRFRKAGDELSFARIHSLCWEIHDQAGDYKRGLEIIEKLVQEPGYRQYIQRAERGQFRVDATDDNILKDGRRLARQKVMCCLAYGFALYRMQVYGEAEQVFSECERFLKDVLIDAKSRLSFFCSGTQARVHYFRGQLFRSRRNFTAARQEFIQSLMFAHKRLTEAKNRGHADTTDQLFANHCCAKVLAFGFGWALLLSGELSQALEQIQAARIGLADSNDHYLNWQVEMLCCAAERAKKGIDVGVIELLPRIRECHKHLEGHPDYFLQAQRELAVANLAVAQAIRTTEPQDSDIHLQRARELVEDSLSRYRNSQETLNKQVPTMVLLSRIWGAERNDQWSKERYDLARKAYDLARDKNLPDHVRAETAIGLGEALVAGNERSEWLEALTLFREALESSKDNVLVRCACHLHITNVHLYIGSIVDARASFAKWKLDSHNIEHGWLLKKAEELEKTIDARLVYLVEGSDTRTLDQLNWNFFQFLVDREDLHQGAHFDVHEAARRLGIKPATFADWQHKLKNNIKIHRQFHLPREERQDQ
jgi:tetratricopeptide (TPR) repeat protein